MYITRPLFIIDHELMIKYLFERRTKMATLHNFLQKLGISFPHEKIRSKEDDIQDLLRGEPVIDLISRIISFKLDNLDEDRLKNDPELLIKPLVIFEHAGNKILLLANQRKLVVEYDSITANEITNKTEVILNQLNPIVRKKLHDLMFNIAENSYDFVNNIK